MKKRNCLILCLALVLALTLTVSLPGGCAQAQPNDPAVSYGPAGQNYASSFYGSNGSGYAYCPMDPGYGYSAPATQDYRQYASSARNSGYQGAWCPSNSGYARGYRGDWGSCW